jgi:hypothetical protein
LQKDTDILLMTEQAAAPKTPAASHRMFYAKSDGIYYKDSAGNEVKLASMGNDDNFVTDAEKIVIGNTSGANSGDSATPAETATTIGIINHGVAAKGLFADNDEIPVIDSEASNVLKKNLWSVVKSALKTYFDGIYATGTIPVKATGAEIDTGTDNDKFTTAKSLKDSHNVPSVVPSTAGNELTSNGTDWTSDLWSVTKVKSADESVTSSITLQDDNHLTFAVGANEVWAVFIKVYFRVGVSTNSNGGLKVTITVPAATTGSFCYDYNDNMDTYKNGNFGVAFATSLQIVANDTVEKNIWLYMEAYVSTTNAGSVTFQFAQVSSSIRATIAKQASQLIAKRIS